MDYAAVLNGERARSSIRGYLDSLDDLGLRAVIPLVGLGLVEKKEIGNEGYMLRVEDMNTEVGGSLQFNVYARQVGDTGIDRESWVMIPTLNQGDIVSIGFLHLRYMIRGDKPKYVQILKKIVEGGSGERATVERVDAPTIDSLVPV